MIGDQPACVMKVFPEMVVCSHCDSAYHRVPLARGQIARCQRCAATLYRADRLSIDAWLACALTAGVAFIVANLYPVVRIGFEASYNEATAWQAVLALAQGPAAAIMVPAMFAVVIIPFIQITSLIWILFFARAGRRAPGFTPVMRWLERLRPWSMIEVSMLGVLVTMIKLSGVLDVKALPGAWAMAALMILITLIAHRDMHRLWDVTEASAPSTGTTA